MSLKIKLFITILVPSLILVGIFYTILNQVGTQTNHAYETYITDKIITAVIIVKNKAADYVVARRADIKSEIIKQLRDLEENVNQMKNLAVTGAKRKRADELIAAFKTLREDYESLLEAVDSGDRERTAKLQQEIIPRQYQEFLDCVKTGEGKTPEGFESVMGAGATFWRDLRFKQIVTAIAAVGLSLLAALIIALSITGPIGNVTRHSQAMARGDISHTPRPVWPRLRIVGPGDEVGRLFSSLSSMTMKMREMIQRIKGQSRKVAENSADIAQVSRKIAVDSESQAGALKETFERVRSMIGAIEQVASTSDQMYRSMNETMKALDQLTESIAGVSKSVSELEQNVEGAKGAIEGVSGDAQQMAARSLDMAGSVEDATSVISQMVASIEGVTQGVKETDVAVERTSEATDRMMDSFKDMSNKIFKMDDEMISAAGIIEDLVVSISEVDDNARAATETSGQARSIALEGGKIVQNAITAFHKTMETIESASRGIGELDKSSSEIGDILNVIHDIADQTNLLALNAAIEAARAGEHGRGFAVVANEVRKLAERSSGATKEIGVLIKGIREETKLAVQAMSETSAQAAQGSKQADEAGLALKKILDAVDKTAMLNEAISFSTRDQSTGSDGVRQAMVALQDVSNEMKEAISLQSESASEVHELINILRERSRGIFVATQEQNQGAKTIIEAMTRLKDISTDITASTERQAWAARLISDSVSEIARRTDGIFQAAGSQRSNTERISESSRRLSSLADELARLANDQRGAGAELSRFLSQVGQITGQTHDGILEVDKRVQALLSAMDDLESAARAFHLE